VGLALYAGGAVVVVAQPLLSLALAFLPVVGGKFELNGLRGPLKDTLLLLSSMVLSFIAFVWLLGAALAGLHG
jgi:hypothetical protein